MGNDYWVELGHYFLLWAHQGEQMKANRIQPRPLLVIE